MTDGDRSPGRQSLRTGSADFVRRAAAIAVGAVGVVLFVLGTRAFAHVVTGSFSSAGYAIVPLGMFIVTIGLLPLMSLVHRLWISGRPEIRAAEDKRNQRDEARVRLSQVERRRRTAEGD